MVEVSLFAGASDVVCTVDHGLHPAKSAIAGGADVRGVKGRAGECYKRVAAFVKLQSAFGGVAGANDFALVGDIYKKICDRTGGSSKNWVAGADYAYAFE